MPSGTHDHDRKHASASREGGWTHPEHPPESERPGLVVGWTVPVAVVLILAGALLAYFVWTELTQPDPKPLPREFSYDLTRYLRVDPSLICADRVQTIETGLLEVRALATGPDDAIVVGGLGDQGGSVYVYSSEGVRQVSFGTSAVPQCIAVSDTAKMYVGFRERIEAYSGAGKKEAEFKRLGEESLLTSLAVSSEEIFAADAGRRVVWRYSLTGELVGRLSPRDGRDDASTRFIVPSPFFDLAFAPDGLLRVVNPGRHRIEAYTAAGHMELSWGKPSFRIEGFQGCCNPAHIAVLPGGEFVTSEKGVARVKLYDAQGEFVCVIAGPEQLGDDGSARDLAADSKQRVLVLDPATRSVIIFKRVDREAGSTGTLQDAHDE